MSIHTLKQVEPKMEEEAKCLPLLVMFLVTFQLNLLTCLASGDTIGMQSERPYTKTSRTTYGGGSKMSSTSGNVMFSFLMTNRKLRLIMHEITLARITKK